MHHLRADTNECRPAQLYGAWACEPSYLQGFVDQARSADLVSLRAERRALIAAEKSALAEGQPPAKLYKRTETGVAIIELSGPMTKYPTSFQDLFGGTSTLQARAALRAAVRDPEIAGILVLADTPGGTHAGTGDLADAIRAASKVKPTFAYAEDLAASAGVWAISAGQRVFANRSAIIGSIGVFSVIHDRSAEFAQAGVEVHVISSGPPIKGAGVAGSKVLPEQLADWKRMVDDMCAVFVQCALVENRGMSLRAAQALATGEVWGAEEAIDKGLIDGVCSLDEAIDAVRKEKAMSTTTISLPSATAVVEILASDTSQPDQPTADAMAPPSPQASDTVTIPAAELASLQALAGQATQLAKEQRTNRFKALASDLGLPAQCATMLDTISAAVDADTFGELETAFRAQAAQINAAGLFRERGTADPKAAAADDPSSQIKAIAKSLLDKGEAKTMAKAMTLAARNNPDLYQAHLTAGRS